MADSGDDEDGKKPTVYFLFGNVDAKGKLEDASYMDEDARESLEALGQERLGAGLSQLTGLGAQNEQDQAEVEKDAMAVDFYDEAEMVDYTPPLTQVPGSGLLAAVAAHPAAPVPGDDDDYDEDGDGDASQPASATPRLPVLGPASRILGTSTVPLGPHMGNTAVAPLPGIAEDGEKVELPVLTANGESAVLRFSQLFAPTWETIKPDRLPLKRLLAASAPRQAEESGSEEDEADAFHHQLAVGSEHLSSSEDEDAEATEESEAATHAPGPGEEAPALPSMRHGRQRKQHPGESLSVGLETRCIGFVVLPDSHFEAIQQLYWEAGIVWDEDAHAPSQDALEEHEIEGRDGATAKHDELGSHVAEEAEAAVAAEERRQSGVQASTSQVLHQANAWLAEGVWEDYVSWEDTGLAKSTGVSLDLNDPHMTFQMAKLAHSPSLLDDAAAQVLPAAAKVRPVQAPPAGKGLVYALLARQNVSQDEEYARRKAKKGSQPAFRFKHATPAASLQTLPVRYADLREYEHRPRGLWLPLPSKARAKAKEGEKSTVKIWSLVGHGKDAVNRIFKAVDLQATTLIMLWDVLRAGGKFADLARLEASKWGIWYRGPQPHAVARDVPLAQADVLLDANMDLSLVVTGMQPLPSATANTIPGPSANTAPSVAFQKTKQLTGADGHIVLLEYMEEHPLLLSRPGMTVRLSTYYRRQSPTDSQHQRLLAAAGERWRVGAVEALQPQESSPFYLGDLAPGAHQLSVDANMFRSPAFPHTRAASDFLVLRAASGALSLRELSGCLAVGQQEPLRRVPAPNSKECRDMEEARMVAYVLRELRRQQSKRDKGRSKEEPSISVRELANLFPDLSEGVIRARLKDRCGCVPLRDDAAGTHRLAEGVAIADERELRQLARPEDWCAHESMTAGLDRLLRSGVANQDRLAGLPQERMHIAAEQLSPPEKYAMALAELDLAVQTAPWALTDNFVSAVRDGRGALALTGPGDPTARGQGFSYMRENIKAPSVKAVTAMPAAKEGNITGTDKDLRRLTMKESKVILMKMGLTEDEVKGLSRWQRIAAVRDLSSAAAGEEGGELGKLGLRYARSNRTSADEAQRARKVQAQQIFERQAAVLGGPVEEAEDGGSDAESWGDELEKELEGDDPSAAQQTEDVDEDAELEDLEELRRDGFLREKPEGTFSSTKPKLLAKPGERRIKRTIRYIDDSNEGQIRVIIYKDRDKIHALNELYKKDGKEAVIGFGKRRVVGGGALPVADEDSPLAKKRKLSRVKCKACGQMGHYKSNRNCPMYAQTYATTAQGKPLKNATKPKRETGEDGGDDDYTEKNVGAQKPPGLRITISSSALGSPSSKRRLSTDLSSPTLGSSLKRAPSKSGAGSARRQLANAVLYKVLSLVKKQLPESMWAPFKMAVAKSSAPDYANFIPAAEEMHLEKIERKIKNAKYNSSEEMLADFGRIVRNASIYNAPGNGKFGGPAIVGWAENLQNAVLSLLQSEPHARTAGEVEAAIMAEDAEREAQKDTRQAASKVLPEAPDELEGPEETDHWVQCSKCHKWRNVSQKVADETVTSNPDAPWFCNWDTERPNASCDQLDDYEMSLKLGIS